MKKKYFAPETNIYKVNVVSHLMQPSSFEFVDDPIDPKEFDDASREENADGNNRSNVWDNIW